MGAAFPTDNVFNRPLPPFDTWPSTASQPRLLYTEGEEELVMSSDTCNGAECIGGADHLMLATRAAARVYMETVFLNYYTWPSCSRWTHREPFRCDIDGPAKALGFEGLTSGLLMSHGIGICKTGLMRHSVRSRSASGMRSMEAWIRSLSHHRPSLPLRPLGNRNHSDKTPLCFSGLAR